MDVKCTKCGSTNTYFDGYIIIFVMACYRCLDCGNDFAITNWEDPKYFD